MNFHKAERKKSKIRLALCGPSGSGKTYSLKVYRLWKSKHDLECKFNDLRFIQRCHW
jgi:ABC-type lipoprotein export system ATPase subunit